MVPAVKTVGATVGTRDGNDVAVGVAVTGQESVGRAVGLDGDAEGARVGDSEGPVGAAVGTVDGATVVNDTAPTKPAAVTLPSEWKRIVMPVELATTMPTHAAPLHLAE
jgi:hypothetical protein